MMVEPPCVWVGLLSSVFSIETIVLFVSSVIKNTLRKRRVLSVPIIWVMGNHGGAEGNWTPVRKPVLTTFFGCSRSFRSPVPERRQTGFQVWQPLVHQRLQGNSSMTFTTSRRHIPARGTARYDGSALRQLLTQNCNLRLNLKVRRLKWFRPHYPLIEPQDPRRSLYGPMELKLLYSIPHLKRFVKRRNAPTALLFQDLKL